MNCKDLRLQICAQRKALSKAELIDNSHSVFTKLLSLSEFQQAKSVGVYMATNGEIETTEMIEHCWQHKKKVYIPKLLPNFQMHFCEYPPKAKLIENRYNILEPSQTHPIDSVKLDLILVPMVAFDHQGHRIGMGAGYYDRHFEYQKDNNSNKPLLIGISHNFQEVSTISAQSWDIAMPIIITNSDIKKPSKKC